jgi:2-polyprenyl-6-methoxyphenol hydroxylase-like FAD-dependent oxidoreductase
LRKVAGLPLQDLGAPIDVFWFRIPKERTPENRTQAFIGAGEIVVIIDRGDYFQCARVIQKGSADAVRANGIDRFREDIVATAPVTRAGINALNDWEEVKLLSVSLDRLTQWHRPGLLVIGDAAHAMSPVGGVGINLAIQDAVAAANILAAAMARGESPDPLLAKVQDRRMFPVKVIQTLQRAIHKRVLGSALASRDPRAPWQLKLVDAVPLLQRVPARLLGLGVKREHIRSPSI